MPGSQREKRKKRKKTKTKTKQSLLFFGVNMTAHGASEFL